VHDFVRQEFADRHRYALALHTDKPHPHVHVVVRAKTEDGVYLNIRKPMLRKWRQEFARLLRTQGVAAKATRGPCVGGRKDATSRESTDS
jgi:hypothetical protein